MQELINYSLNKSTALVTGAAGFIGAALVKRLLQSGSNVIGIDNLNSYYAPSLKRDRLIYFFIFS